MEPAPGAGCPGAALGRPSAVQVPLAGTEDPKMNPLFSASKGHLLSRWGRVISCGPGSQAGEHRPLLSEARVRVRASTGRLAEGAPGLEGVEPSLTDPAGQLGDPGRWAGVGSGSISQASWGIWTDRTKTRSRASHSLASVPCPWISKPLVLGNQLHEAIQKQFKDGAQRK